MMDAFRTPLPLTFRVNMSGKFRESTRNTLEKTLFPGIRAHTTRPPRALRWYPDALAWQVDVPKDVDYEKYSKPSSNSSVGIKPLN